MTTEVGRLQGQLYRWMSLMGLASLVLGVIFRVPTWGMAVALGFAATSVYYWLLGGQVVRTTGLGRVPSPMALIIPMLGRQAVCVLACWAALRWWGPAWIGCLVALLIGRHWIMYVSLRQGPGEA